MDLCELLEQSRPPDSEMADLIEQAFLEGQIDGLKASLAYCSLTAVRISTRFCAKSSAILEGQHIIYVGYFVGCTRLQRKILFRD